MRIRKLVLPAFLLVSCSSAPEVPPTGSGGGSSSSVSSSSSSGGASDCDPGTKRCGTGCAPIGSPDTGCASPSCDPCSFDNATATCAGGTCALASCVQGWSDCDSNAANGCETHTATDPDHCGGCGTACSFEHAASMCIGGTCLMGSCATGWADCSAASGCETNTDTDATNCGGCQKVCANGEACEGGACVSCSQHVNDNEPADSAGYPMPNGNWGAFGLTVAKQLKATRVELAVQYASGTTSAYLVADVGGHPAGTIAGGCLLAQMQDPHWYGCDLPTGVLIPAGGRVWIAVYGPGALLLTVAGSTSSFYVGPTKYLLGPSTMPSAWVDSTFVGRFAARVIGSCP